MDTPVISPSWASGIGDPEVASDGTTGLAVWVDQFGNQALMATRIDSEGVPLDPGGIILTTGIPDSVAVTYDGASFLVVWIGFAPVDGIWGARVTAGGAVLDSPPIEIAPPGSYGALRTASNGSSTLVVWSSSSGIQATRVGQDGIVLDAAPLTFTGTVGATIASNGVDYLSVYQSGGTTWASRISADGVLLDPSSIAVSTMLPAGKPAVAYGSGSYLVASAGATLVQGVRIDSSGVVLDPTPLTFYDAGVVSLAPRAAELASAGAGFLVTWLEQTSPRAIRGRVLDSAAVPITPALTLSSTPVALASFIDQPAVAFAGGKYLALWKSDSATPPLLGAYWIDGVALPADGALVPPSVHVSPTFNVQRPAAISFDGGEGLAVWGDWREPPGLYGARIGSDGIPLDVQATPIATDAPGLIGGQPSLAWSGTQYLAAWVWFGADPELLALRLDATGNPIDPAPIVMATDMVGVGGPAMATNGTDFLVAWYRYPYATGDLAYSIVRADGTLGPTTTIAYGSEHGSPALLSVGGSYILAWAGGDRLNARAIDAAGEVQSSFSLPAPGIRPGQIALSFDGAKALAVWSADAATLEDDGDLFGAIVDPEGSYAAGPFLLAGGPKNQIAPRAVFDGWRHIVTWSTYEGGVESVLFTTTVTPSGAVSDLGVQEIGQQSLFGAQADLAVVGIGATLLAYVPRMEPLRDRVYLRRLDEEPAAAPDAGASDAGAPDADPSADSGVAAPDAGAVDMPDDAGCGCRVARPPHVGQAGALFLLLLASVFAFSRRGARRP